MQAITTIGLDIAKSVFQVHGIDAEGNVVLRRQLKRRYVLAFFQKLPSCRSAWRPVPRRIIGRARMLATRAVANAALRLSPFEPLGFVALNGVFLGHFLQGCDAEAAEAARRALQINPLIQRQLYEPCGGACSPRPSRRCESRGSTPYGTTAVVQHKSAVCRRRSRSPTYGCVGRSGAVGWATGIVRALLLLAQSGHSDCRNECPLLSVKRTSQFAGIMSPSDPKRTSAAHLRKQDHLV
jgi:hypothetical protein